jgi:hypothetical protein
VLCINLSTEFFKILHDVLRIWGRSPDAELKNEMDNNDLMKDKNNSILSVEGIKVMKQSKISNTVTI